MGVVQFMSPIGFLRVYIIADEFILSLGVSILPEIIIPYFNQIIMLIALFLSTLLQVSHFHSNDL